VSLRILSLMLFLAGCAATGPVRERVTIPAPAKSQLPLIGPALDQRNLARNFVAVVAAVEPVAEAQCRARNPGVNCDFQIVVDDRPGQPPNAFQTLDDAGRPIIAFTLSLIGQVENPDELAFVMSHEAAHHILGHLARQRQNATLGAQVFGSLAGTISGGDAGQVRAAQELGAAVGARTYSKEFELEADALGTEIVAAAGFNPLRGAEFFFRIPDPGNRFLGTHPPNADRVAIVRQTAARLGITGPS
jgi:predicted Zn-dependent protease